MITDKTSLNKLPKIINYLKKEGKAPKSRIASYIQSDIRTTKTMLNTLSDLKLIKCASNTGRAKFSYSLAKGKNRFILNPDKHHHPTKKL